MQSLLTIIFDIVKVLPMVAFFYGITLICKWASEEGWLEKDARLWWCGGVAGAAAAAILIAEILGRLNELNASALWFVWAGVDCGLYTLICRKFRVALWFPTIPQSKLFRFVLLPLVACVLWAALTCPPNVWDSMTYHMPRIMHWIQQGSLNNYPTNILRQLESPPGAELLLLNIALLTGNDYLLNMPEFLAMITCGIAASFMAEQICIWYQGKKVSIASFIAAVLAMTIPAGIPDAISTQNDYLTAQWLLMFVMLTMMTLKDRRGAYQFAACLVFALGMANKMTMAIIALPFVAALFCNLLSQTQSKFLATMFALATCILVLNSPWMTRNQQLFKNISGSDNTRQMQLLSKYSLPKMEANIVRNASLYTTTPLKQATSAVNWLVTKAIQCTGEPLQDTGSVWQGQTFYMKPESKVTDGDGFGGWITVLPFLIVIGFGLKMRMKFLPICYLALVCGSFILFSSILKWQPWHQRLHLAIFMLVTPLAGVVIAETWDEAVAYILASFLCLNALLVLYYNPQFPVFRLSESIFKTREQRYFCRRPELYDGETNVAQQIVNRGFKDVLLQCSGDSWEYPMWALLKDRGFAGSINQTMISNESFVFVAPMTNTKAASITLP